MHAAVEGHFGGELPVRCPYAPYTSARDAFLFGVCEAHGVLRCRVSSRRPSSVVPPGLAALIRINSRQLEGVLDELLRQQFTAEATGADTRVTESLVETIDKVIRALAPDNVKRAASMRTVVT